MKAQFDNKLNESFMLWLQHKIVKNGEAFENHSSLFYPTAENYGGLYSYSAPFRPFVSDVSITGATIPTGIYVDGSFSITGQNDLYEIDYANGMVYFTANKDSNVISGQYSVQEIAFESTDRMEEELLFETKYELRPRVSQVISGLAPEENTYPVILVRNAGGKNIPFELGGIDETEITFRCVFLADSQFMLDAVGSICRDAQRCHVPILSESEFPFNSFGGYRNGAQYNYDTISAGKITLGNSAFVSHVYVTDYTRRSIATQLRSMNPNIYVSIIEFMLTTQRTTRL